MFQVAAEIVGSLSQIDTRHIHPRPMQTQIQPQII